MFFTQFAHIHRHEKAEVGIERIHETRVFHPMDEHGRFDCAPHFVLSLGRPIELLAVLTFDFQHFLGKGRGRSGGNGYDLLASIRGVDSDENIGKRRIFRRGHVAAQRDTQEYNHNAESHLIHSAHPAILSFVEAGQPFQEVTAFFVNLVPDAVDHGKFFSFFDVVGFVKNPEMFRKVV